MAFKDLRGILQYVPQFRGRTFVVCVEGGVLSSDRLSTLALDLALLHSLNVHLVLVYGVAQEIGEAGARTGAEGQKNSGLGLHDPVDPPTLQAASEVAARVGSAIAGSLSAAGLRSVVPNAIAAHAAGVVNGVDQGHRGKVDRVDAEALRRLMDQEMLPVLSPLGYGSQGEPLLINSDELAVEVGVALQASKVIFLASGDPLLPDHTPPMQLTVLQANELSGMANEQDDKRLASKLKYAARGCQLGIARCHLLNGLQDESLLAELFSNAGVGTMVHADDYLQVRDATHGDIPEMTQMMQQAVEDGELLPRTADQLAAQLRDFSVLEVDGNLVACVAVHHHGEQLAELACLYVKRTHEGRGYGSRLIRHAEESAKESGAQQLFALSTGAYHYFEKRGFERRDSFPLPEKRLEASAESGRNSVILVSDLATAAAQ